MKKMGTKAKMIIAALAFAIVHGLLYFAFGLKNYAGEGVNVSIFGMGVCLALLVLEIALIILCRIKKWTWMLKGLFLYKLIGMIFFVIAFAVCY